MERCHVGSKVECWKSRLGDRADGPVSGRIREGLNIRLSEYAPLTEADPDGSGFGVQRCPMTGLQRRGLVFLINNGGNSGEEICRSARRRATPPMEHRPLVAV